jgi:hypothetical protein
MNENSERAEGSSSAVTEAKVGWNHSDVKLDVQACVRKAEQMKAEADTRVKAFLCKNQMA